MTTAEQAADLLKSLPWWVVVGMPVALTAALGFLASRISFTKKEKTDFEQANFTNAKTLLAEHDAAYAKYTDAITAYSEAAHPNFELFKNIASCGDSYLMQACSMCDAILSSKVDVQMRDNTLVPKISDIVSRTLPRHYETLQSIAKSKGWEYRGELRRKDYRSLYAVVEKFHRGEP
jgi:hypothetical protein